MYTGKFTQSNDSQKAKQTHGGDDADIWESDIWKELEGWQAPEAQSEKSTEEPLKAPERKAPEGNRASHAPKGKTKPYVWLIPLAALILVVGAGIWCMSRYVMVGLHFYPRNATVLDLRGKDLSPSQYDKLSEKLPDCRIYWDISFQGLVYPSNTTSLTVNSLSDRDVTTLDYFTGLKTLDARNCMDYANLKALEKRRPKVDVEYGIVLGEQSFDPGSRAITLSGIGEEEISRVVYLENLKTVTVQGGGSIKNYRALQSYCHDHGISFQLWLGEEGVEDDARTVTIEHASEEDLSLLSLLENLEELTLVNPKATPETVFSLEAALPEVAVSWNVQFGDMTFTPEMTEVDLSAVKVDSLQEVEEAMAYLPNVETLFMGEQDISHDDMAAFRERVRDKYKVVWYIRLGDSKPIRTDITYFMPGRDCHIYNVAFSDATSYNIRYCEDLVAVDVGHLGVTDTSWVGYLTNLEYLILAHTDVQYIDGIENCKKLKFLELDWSGIRTLEPLKGCTALEDLNIGNTWPDVSALKEMPWLKNIYMIYGSGKDAAALAQALPDTHVVASGTATVASGWRRLPNYYAMRDALHAYYMN